MTSSIVSGRSVGRVALVMIALLAWPAWRAAAQAITVSTAGDALKIRAPGFTFLKGEPLVRLKDGRSVRIELTLTVLAGGDKSPVAESRQIFTLSYDLWEERFAVTAGARSPSISHLTVSAAEAWCIEQLSVAASAPGRDRPFWIRLEYRILDGGDPPNPDAGEGFTLQALIEALSRRRKAESPTHSIEAGPFRLPPRDTGPSPR